MLSIMLSLALQLTAALPWLGASPPAARPADPIGPPHALVRSAPHPTAGRAPVCVVRHSLEARYRAYGYDHIVHLNNGCQRDAVCSISTDVSPTRLKARVNAGRRIEVLTFRGSPSRVFKATVACKPTS